MRSSSRHPFLGTGRQCRESASGLRRRTLIVNPQQRFLLLLILVGALATVLGLVSKRARMLPYPVVLAAAGIAVGLLPGGNFPTVGPDVILLAFVPGLVFEAALTLDLPELRRRVVPVSLLATVGVALTVLL